jgi:hypothetical protein
MGDFVESSITKTAVRKLAAPIADLTAFNTIVDGVVSGNPWACTAYQVGSTNYNPVTKSKQAYTARIAYQDGDAKTVGTVSAKAPTTAGFNAAITAITADTALQTAIGGTPSHNPTDDTYSLTLKCHDANGEVYTVSFSKDRVTIASYTDDAIRTKIETWADGVPALA